MTGAAVSPARWPAVVAVTLLAATALVLFRQVGALMIDDAWISFRYAAHLATGDGLVFNPGERVQGFTNPLYTLLLALGAAVGIDIPRAALGVGFAGAVAAAAALVCVRRGALAATIGAAFALALLLLPEFLLNSVSGMETALFCGLLTWSFVAWMRGWWRAAGTLQGLLLITRPDAVFWIAPGLLWLLWRNRPAFVRQLIPLAAIAGAWFLFAWIYYGSPIPHSIAAKRLIHAGEFGTIATATPGLNRGCNGPCVTRTSFNSFQRFVLTRSRKRISIFGVSRSRRSYPSTHSMTIIRIWSRSRKFWTCNRLSFWIRATLAETCPIRSISTAY